MDDDVFVTTGLPMQSSGAPVSETSAIYCQTLMTTANGGTKPVAVASNQRHFQRYASSHLVTNRAYTASKLTSDYMSELSVEKPSEVLRDTIPHGKSQLESRIRHPIGDGMTLQKKDIPSINNTNNDAEYVQFIPSSLNSSSSASTLDTLKAEELATLHSNQTLAKNDNLYSQIKDDDYYEPYNDVIHPASGHSVATAEGIVVERDRLLKRVSILTVEKQDMVYKLRDFVETNAQLYSELERSRSAVVELQNKLRHFESKLESMQRENALMNSRFLELTSMRTSNTNEHYVNQKPSANIIWHQTFEEAAIKKGDNL